MSKGRVLIVDDEPDLLTALARSVRGAGFEVGTVASGEQALEAVKKERPALILSDVMMPGVNGFQMTRKLKEDSETKDIPVLLMSAKTDPADIYWAEEVGAIELLKKPLDMRVLVGKLEQAMASVASAEGSSPEGSNPEGSSPEGTGQS